MSLNRRDFVKLGSMGGLALLLDLLKPDLMGLGAQPQAAALPRMLYRAYGRTGKNVSILGFGGMRFDEQAVRKGNLEDPARLMVEAYELGLNYFDTAPTYVDNKSEEIFGLAFKEIDRKIKGQPGATPYYCTSKSGIWMEPDAAAVRRRLDTTLKRLGKDKLHFYHMWCIMNEQHFQGVMKPGGPYEGALAAKKEGLIDHLVFSSHADCATTTKIIRSDAFEGLLIGYNMLNFPRQEKAIQAAVDQKIGVVIMNPLGGGLIPRNQDYFRKMVNPRQKGITVGQTALNFIMGQEGITVALAGISNREQLHEDVGALRYLEVFSDQKLAELKRQYLRKIGDICTTCGYCKGCPVDIPVWTVMEFYNSYVLRGKEHARKVLQSYKDEDNIDIKALVGKCIQCGACEKVCTQHLPILKRFATITREF
ncbi:MAG: aldo/keto reductase [Acidobacteria bacterium]|nr:aldo/keto reductase [Acidobacteriota bacterium]